MSCDNNDKRVRNWFAAEVKSIDPNVKYFVDKMGSQWAVFPGERNDIPPIGMGSHMDSVQNGGRFDGQLGVFTALEVARVISAAKAQGRKTFAPFAVIKYVMLFTSPFQILLARLIDQRATIVGQMKKVPDFLQDACHRRCGQGQ